MDHDADEAKLKLRWIKSVFAGKRKRTDDVLLQTLGGPLTPCGTIRRSAGETFVMVRPTSEWTQVESRRFKMNTQENTGRHRPALDASCVDPNPRSVENESSKRRWILRNRNEATAD